MKINSRRVLFAVVVVVVVFNAVQFWRAPQADTRRIKRNHLNLREQLRRAINQIIDYNPGFLADRSQDRV